MVHCMKKKSVIPVALHVDRGVAQDAPRFQYIGAAEPQVRKQVHGRFAEVDGEVLRVVAPAGAFEFRRFVGRNFFEFRPLATVFTVRSVQSIGRGGL